MNARSAKRASGLAAAAARNTGWRAARPAPWVVFLDDADMAYRRAATVAGGAWLAATAEFAAARILPGPRTPREITVMAATSTLIPHWPPATGHRQWHWRQARTIPHAAAIAASPHPAWTCPAAALECVAAR
jgi:hypothetical protein